MKKLILSSFSFFILLITIYSLASSTSIPSLNISCNFEDVYPAKWYQSVILLYGITFLLIPVSAWLIYRSVKKKGRTYKFGWLEKKIGKIFGSKIDGPIVSKVRSGLSRLGGGPRSKKRYGVAGGIAVISVLIELFLIPIFEIPFLFIPENSIETNLFTAIQIPKNIGSEEIRNYVEKNVNLSQSEHPEDLVSAQKLAQKIAELTNFEEKNKFWDILVSAIYNYNLHNMDIAKQKINLIRTDANKNEDGFIQYILGMIAFAEGDTETSVKFLKNSLLKNEETIIYLTLSMIYNDIALNAEDPNHKQTSSDLAIHTLVTAREKVDSNNFSVNNTLASYYFNGQRYENAIAMYKEALAEITINEYEAMCKMNIAACFKKLNDDKNAAKWYADALDEISDNKKLQEHFIEMYNSKVKASELAD